MSKNPLVEFLLPASTPLYVDRSGRPHYLISGAAADDDEPKIDSLTHPECVSRLEEITEEAQRLSAKEARSAADEQYLTKLASEFDAVDARRAKLEADAESARMQARVSAVVRGRGDGGGYRVEGGSSSRSDYDRDAIMEPDSIEEKRFKNPWDLSEVRTFGRDVGDVTSELKARALSAVGKMQGANDKIRAAATDLLERWDDADGNLSRLALTISSPTYLRAWSKNAVNPVNADLTTDERRALETSKQLQRAMSLTDPAGGFLVPFQLDPTVILTSDGSYNEIRQIARTVVATGDVWNGVSAGAVAWSFDAEAAEVSDDSPTFGAPAIPVRTARGFVPISLEARMDAANVTQEVGRLLAQGKDDLEAEKFITGLAANNEPVGVITALTGVTASTVPSTTVDTFAFGDLYKVQGALAGRYRRRASWLANNLFWNTVRQAAPDGVWKDPEGDRAGNLLGRPVHEAEAMDGVVNATVDNLVAIFGDFGNYVIADRVGMTVDFIPHLFGSNRRPTGQSGWFAFYRVGTGVVNSAAFRVYNVT